MKNVMRHAALAAAITFLLHGNSLAWQDITKPAVPTAEKTPANAPVEETTESPTAPIDDPDAGDTPKPDEGDAPKPAAGDSPKPAGSPVPPVIKARTLPPAPAEGDPEKKDPTPKPVPPPPPKAGTTPVSPTPPEPPIPAVPAPEKTPPSKTDPDAEKLAGQLLELLWQEVLKNEDLSGVLVTAEPDPETPIKVQIVLIADTDNETVTPETIESLIKDHVTPDMREITVERRPMRKLLDTLREYVAESDDLMQTRIDGVYLRGEPRELVISGFVGRAKHRQILRVVMSDIAAEIYRESFGEDGPAPPDRIAAELELLNPPDDASEELRQKLAEQITELVMKSDDLFGSAVEVYRDARTQKVRFQVSLVGDTDQTDQEKVDANEVARLSNDLLPEGSSDPIMIVRHPMQAILAELRDYAATRPKDIRIDNVRYNLQSAPPRLLVKGVVTDLRDRSTIEVLTGQLMESRFPVAMQEVALRVLDVPDPLNDEKPGYDLISEVDTLVRETPGLFGAVIDIYRDAVTELVRYTLTVIVGSENAATEQDRAAIERIDAMMAKALPDGQYDPLKTDPQPLDKALRDLQAECRDQPSLAGVFITGIHLEPSSALGLVTAKLQGELSRFDQRQIIRVLSEDLLPDDYQADGTALAIRRPDEATLLKQLNDLVQSERALTGCLIEGAEYLDATDGVVIELSGRVAHTGQRSDLGVGLHQQLTPVFGPTSVAVRASHKLRVEWLPTDDLVEQFQLDVDVYPELNGCVIHDMEYVAAEFGEGEVLRLSARTSRADQLRILEAQLHEFVNDRYERWTRLDVSSENVEIIPSSYVLGTRLYNAGLNYYIREDYDAAYNAFTQANIEAPGQLHYQYWRVIAEISVDKMDAALHHVRPLVQLRRRPDNAYTQQYLGTLRKIERVQGSVRAKLRKLEEEAMLHGRLRRPRATASLR